MKVKNISNFPKRLGGVYIEKNGSAELESNLREEAENNPGFEVVSTDGETKSSKKNEDDEKPEEQKQDDKKGDK